MSISSATGPPQLTVTELVQVVLVQAEMMPDLVEDGRADFAQQVVLAVAHQLDVFLEDVDDVERRTFPGAAGGVFDAALRQRSAVVQSQQQLVVLHAEAVEQLAAGAGL